MRAKLNYSSRSNNRAAAGTTLALTAAGLVVASIVFLLVTIFTLNVYAYVQYSYKIQMVADEVAKRVGARTFFLGAQRPLFQRSGNALEETKAIAVSTATEMSKILSLPPNASIEVDVPEAEASVDGISISRATVTWTDVPLPFNISGIFPKMVNIAAIGVSTEASEAPPAFIRFGFRLIDPSASNPSVTNATQVVMLPAYGFQTDAAIGSANLGGTQNNNDVVGDQPDARECLWAGINGSPAPLRSNAPFITRPDGSHVTAFN